MENENWKDIIGYEGLYQISNIGNVKSLNFRNTKKEKILKKSLIGPKRKQYFAVCLYKNPKQKVIKIHSLVANAFLNHSYNKTNKIVVDHINNNTLDNSLENLQLITHRENSSKDRKNKTSKYVGVCWCKLNKKWKATININKKSKYLGLFKDEFEAHLTYINKVKEINNGI
jgi:hypothetical protein